MDKKKIEDIFIQIKQSVFLTTDGYYKDAIENVENALVSKPFRIAFVGEFSTGKSTFINSLLGRDLLLHATDEVTATITNIHNVGRDNPKWHTCDVFFADGRNVKLENDQLLLDYTTTKSTLTDVADSIKSVDYFTDFMDPSINTIFVDTPGLNGMADGHRELTLQEVKKADFCFYLIGIRGLAETDKVILKEMSYYQKNFVFIINFIDEIKVSEGESLEEKIEEIKFDLNEEVFSENEIEYEIFGVSALKGLASKDKTIKRLYQGDACDIKDEERINLYNDSKLQDVERYIREKINNSTIEGLVVDRVRHMLINLLDSAIDELCERKNRIDYLRSMDKNQKKIKKMEDRLYFFIESSKKNKNKVINFALSECSSIKRDFLAYLKQSLNDMEDKYYQKFMSFERYEELEKYVMTDGLNSDVKVDADKIYDYVETNMIYCLNGVLNNILLKIQEYLKDSRIYSSTQTINFEIQGGIDKTNAYVLLAESTLRDTLNKKIEANARVELAYENRERKEKEKKSIIKARDASKKALNETIDRKNSELDKIGKIPDVIPKTEYVTEEYIEYEYRGGLGFLDWLCGPKEKKKTRSVPHTYVDDSKRKNWVKKRDAILSRYKSEISRLQSELDINENNIKKIENKIRKAKKDELLAEEDLEFYQQKYIEDEKTLDNLKEKANLELLNSLRNNLISQLNVYCDYKEGKIALLVKEYVDETIEVNKKIICEKATEFFEDRLESLIQIYKNEIDGKTNNNNQKYDDYDYEIKKIESIRKELEYA